MKRHFEFILSFLLFLNINQSIASNFFLTGDLQDLIPIEKRVPLDLGKITVLTQPINEWASQAIQGHIGVTSSVLRGFAKLGLPMNYNPRTIDEVGNHLLVLVDINALYQAIELKRKGRIKTLIVGPNILNNPSEYNHILGSPEIDWYIAPSLWTKICNCEEEPLTKNKTAIWYVGIDAEYWKPDSINTETKTMLIYWKTESENFCNSIEEIIKRHGWKTIRMQYGSYSQREYKDLLNQVDAAVFISVSESQGLALAECWSMNIPTLVWNPREAFVFNRWIRVSSAPYLTKKTGFFWAAFEEFEWLLNNFDQVKENFAPRDWVLDYMTDEASVYLLLDLISYYL